MVAFVCEQLRAHGLPREPGVDVFPGPGFLGRTRPLVRLRVVPEGVAHCRQLPRSTRKGALETESLQELGALAKDALRGLEVAGIDLDPAGDHPVHDGDGPRLTQVLEGRARTTDEGARVVGSTQHAEEPSEKDLERRLLEGP